MPDSRDKDGVDGALRVFAIAMAHAAGCECMPAVTITHLPSGGVHADVEHEAFCPLTMTAHATNN